MTPSADEQAFAGHCLCGEVRFIAQGRPEMVAACHCESCRRHTGAPFAVYADYRRDRVRFTGASPADHASSPGATRSFCPRCGSTIAYRGDSLPDMIHLHVGLFDQANQLVPLRDENVAQRLCWVGRVADD